MRETPAEAVFDASALVRGVLPVEPGDAAAAWVDELAQERIRGLAPDLVFAEVANALSVQVQAGRLEADVAREALAIVIELPLRVISVRALVPEAFERANAARVSVYDATYLVVAEAADAVLVTADRRLAASARRSALLPRDGPTTGA